MNGGREGKKIRQETEDRKENRGKNGKRKIQRSERSGKLKCGK